MPLPVETFFGVYHLDATKGNYYMCTAIGGHQPRSQDLWVMAAEENIS